MSQSGAPKIDGENTSVLLEQYKLRCQEMLVMVPLNRGHVRNFQIIAGAVVGGIALALSRPELLPNAGNWGLWLAFAALLPVITAYLMLDILNTMYIMQLLAEAIARIERRLNCGLGTDLFIWEGRLSQPFFESHSPIPKVVNPGWYIGLFGVVIYTVLTILVPGGAIIALWRTIPSLHSSGYFRMFTGVSSLVASICWFVVMHVAFRLRGMRRLVEAWMDSLVKGDGGSDIEVARQPAAAPGKS